jgi:predicted O-linked N-acetylglucosamine transferase (SPINDLY family)
LAAERPDIQLNLGEALRQAGDPATAEVWLRRAVALAPFLPEAHYNLGNALKALGRHPEAITCYEDAVRLRPNYARAWYNLGNTLREEGRAAAAAVAYRRAVSLSPDWGDAHLNLANALYDLRELNAAAEHYLRAQTLTPDDPAVADSLGNVYHAQGRTADAAACYRAALVRRPGDWLRELRLAAMAPVIADSNAGIDAFRSALAAKLDDLIGRHPAIDLAVLHCCGAEPPTVLAYHGRDDRPLKEKYAALFASALPACELPRRSSGSPRVGVVVTHGHEGVFVRCLGELITRLDRRQLQVSFVCPRASANILRHLLPDANLEYVLIPQRLDEAATGLRAAEFDLLHYWEVGTDSTNYFLPFFRPARAQVAGWGWPVTSGIPAVDWFVSAAELEPLDADAHYTETLARLPSLPTYYIRPGVPNQPADRGRFGVPHGHRLYLCQQNLRKFHPEFDPILAGILRTDPAGHLVVIADEQPLITKMLITRLRQTMPEVIDRVHVAARMERPDYLALVKAADVVLDTLHYGGGANTVYDAAACGTPTVTLPGALHRGRWAAAVNRRLGVPELIVSSADEYVQTAVRSARDTDLRDHLRQRISAASDSLFEDQRAVTELQQFLLDATARR